ncbi:hypothetical protein UPYG_G00064320 [Umbra pygmaea]|uniref:Uncharacterized protein n=1 Tax=Umbra pygmaea TaxID=75934 RepID=A0ABD0XUU6_UMBPY
MIKRYKQFIQTAANDAPHGPDWSALVPRPQRCQMLDDVVARNSAIVNKKVESDKVLPVLGGVGGATYSSTCQLIHLTCFRSPVTPLRKDLTSTHCWIVKSHWNTCLTPFTFSLTWNPGTTHLHLQHLCSGPSTIPTDHSSICHLPSTPTTLPSAIYLETHSLSNIF